MHKYELDAHMYLCILYMHICVTHIYMHMCVVWDAHMYVYYTRSHYVSLYTHVFVFMYISTPLLLSRQFDKLLDMCSPSIKSPPWWGPRKRPLLIIANAPRLPLTSLLLFQLVAYPRQMPFRILQNWSHRLLCLTSLLQHNVYEFVHLTLAI